MRSFLRAMVLAMAVCSVTPDAAIGQHDDEFIEVIQEDPPPRRRVGRRSWRNSPIVLGIAAVVLAVAIPFGVFKVVSQMRYMQKEQQREKAPWERD